MKVRNVVFDVGRVLVEWDLRCLFAKLIDDPAELDWFLANVVTEQWHHQHDEGRDIRAMITERQDAYPDQADRIAAYLPRFLETIPGDVPGTFGLVRRLDESGVPLFAITNFGDTFWAQFRPTRPDLDRFRDIVVSGIENIAKPDPAIFELGADRFGIDPRESLFIDDKADNIAAAEALGWRGHHFRDAETLEADLIARGLLGR